MGKFKFIFILVLALFLICGIAAVVDAPNSFDGSLNLIPVSDSSVSQSDSSVNQSDCENGTCSVDLNKSDDNSSDESSDDEMDYDSKYYDDSLIDGLYFCNDLEHAFKDAKQHHKNVMIIFDGAACIYCEYLKDEGLTDSDIQKEINENDILLMTYTSDSPELSQKLEIYGTPTTVIFDENGTELGRIEGYESPEQFLSELKEYNGK